MFQLYEQMYANKHRLTLLTTHETSALFELDTMGVMLVSDPVVHDRDEDGSLVELVLCTTLYQYLKMHDGQ